MIRTPFTPWTPPIPLDRLPEKKTNERQTSNRNGSGGFAGGTQAKTPTFEALFQQML